MDTELLPCPFCGAKAHNYPSFARIANWSAMCSQCGACGSIGISEEISANNWNRRTPHPNPLPFARSSQGRGDMKKTHAGERTRAERGKEENSQSEKRNFRK